jgi:tRNA (mo5U34)-methyltransferase
VLDQATALALVRDRPWHHTFEIIPGVRTVGNYDPEPLWNDLRLPADLTGVSVADVGASNGFFSFAARKRNARVVAFDFRHKDNSGFGLAQSINGLHDIDQHQNNVLDNRREDFGQFDVVLALGLLYHTADPYRALANCAALSKRRLLIESYCIDGRLPEAVRHEPVMRFIPDPERFPTRQDLTRDRSNYWGFSSECLRRMVEDIGFAARRVDRRGDRVLLDCEREVADDGRTRLWIAYGVVPRTPVGDDPGAPEAWALF